MKRPTKLYSHQNNAQNINTVEALYSQGVCSVNMLQIQKPWIWNGNLYGVIGDMFLGDKIKKQIRKKSV